jgi:hypothetical protein
MAVRQESGPNQGYWAHPSLIAASNTILASKHSVIKLGTYVGLDLTGAAPEGGTVHTLNFVKPENVLAGRSRRPMQIWADCGKCGRDVMGAGLGRGENYDQMTAEYQDVDVQRPWQSKIPIVGGRVPMTYGGSVAAETMASDPKEMKKEIFNKQLGGTGKEGERRYQRMSPENKEIFDRETGINKYAAPSTGEGFTMSSGGANVRGQFTWNFHWAGVVTTSGHDRVTLDNYSVSDPSVKNNRWEFQMFGPADKAGQTFHEQHKATGQHGKAPTSLAVKKR